MPEMEPWQGWNPYTEEIEWSPVGSIEVGRLRLTQDHNGNVDLTVRVSPEYRKQVYSVTDFAGVRLRISFEAPKMIVEALQ